MRVVSCCSAPRRYSDSNWQEIRQFGTQHSPGIVRDLSAPPFSVYIWEPTFITRPNCWAIGLQNEHMFKRSQEVRASHPPFSSLILTCAPMRLSITRENPTGTIGWGFPSGEGGSPSSLYASGRDRLTDCISPKVTVCRNVEIVRKCVTRHTYDVQQGAKN